MHQVGVEVWWTWLLCQWPGWCGGVVNMATVARTKLVWRCGEHGYCANDQVCVEVWWTWLLCQWPGWCGGVVNMATVPRTRCVWRCGEHGYCAKDQVCVEVWWTWLLCQLHRVRTRAITSFALCLESGGVSIKKTIQEMITPCTNTPLPPRLVPTPADNVRTVQHAGRFFVVCWVSWLGWF